MEWQGIGQLGGICGSLKSSGSGGKHPQNIRRDMLRKLAAKNPDSHVPWIQNRFIYECITGWNESPNLFLGVVLSF